MPVASLFPRPLPAGGAIAHGQRSRLRRVGVRTDAGSIHGSRMHLHMVPVAAVLVLASGGAACGNGTDDGREREATPCPATIT